MVQAWLSKVSSLKMGKIFGKMGHSERYEKGLFQNIAGNKDQDIFANGVRYFTHKQVK